jgi:hypothetical protein
VCSVAVAEPQTDAQGHLEQGKHLYEIQDYDGAIAEYQAGYMLEQRAEFLYGMGQAYRMKGDCERAARSYNAVVRAPDGAALADAARRNIDRCRSTTPPQQPPPPEPPPPKPAPPPMSVDESAPWYRDALADTFVIGGAVLIAGGAISWKVGRDQAGGTFGNTTYDAWNTSSQNARNAETWQGVGIAAATVGATAVLAGVIRYAWPSSMHAGAIVTPTGAAAGMSFAF